MRRLLAALSIALVLVLSGCGDDGPKPTGFVSQEQVDAADAASSSSSSTAVAAASGAFCSAWTDLQALNDVTGSEDVEGDLQDLHDRAARVRDAAEEGFHGELDQFIADIERLDAIAARYDYRFDDDTDASDADIAAINETTNALGRFAAASTVARMAFEQCGGDDPSFELPCGARRSFSAVGTQIGGSTTTTLATDPDEIGRSALANTPGAVAVKRRDTSDTEILLALVDQKQVAIKLIELTKEGSGWRQTSSTC